MPRFTHEQAVQAANEFTERYGFRCTVCDTDHPADSILENYSFFGIWSNDVCVSTVAEPKRIIELQKFAAIIARIDQEISQMEELARRGLI